MNSVPPGPEKLKMLFKHGCMIYNTFGCIFKEIGKHVIEDEAKHTIVDSISKNVGVPIVPRHSGISSNFSLKIPRRSSEVIFKSCL